MIAMDQRPHVGDPAGDQSIDDSRRRLGCVAVPLLGDSDLPRYVRPGVVKGDGGLHRAERLPATTVDDPVALQLAPVRRPSGDQPLAEDGNVVDPVDRADALHGASADHGARRRHVGHRGRPRRLRRRLVSGPAPTARVTWFLCTAHRQPRRSDQPGRRGCTLSGPYDTRDEAERFGRRTDPEVRRVAAPALTRAHCPVVCWRAHTGCVGGDRTAGKDLRRVRWWRVLGRGGRLAAVGRGCSPFAADMCVARRWPGRQGHEVD